MVIKVLTVAVALSFFIIMYLEMFSLQTSSAKRIFGISEEGLKNEKMITLFTNQGIYYGVIGLLLVYAFFQ